MAESRELERTDWSRAVSSLPAQAVLEISSGGPEQDLDGPPKECSHCRALQRGQWRGCTMIVKDTVRKTKEYAEYLNTMKLNWTDKLL